MRAGGAEGAEAAGGFASAGAFGLGARFLGFSSLGAADGFARCGVFFEAGFVAAFEVDPEVAFEAALGLAFFGAALVALGLPALAEPELLVPVLALAGFLPAEEDFGAGREAALGAAFAGFLGVTFFRWAMRLEA
mgnify:CR=1 FL=1